MFIFTITISLFLEYRKLLVNIRTKFNIAMQKYVAYFINRNFTTQREIRYAYLAACTPIILILLLLHFILSFHIAFVLVYHLINLMLFTLTVHILTWKEDAKNETSSYSEYNFIGTYATNFFAALFWYVVLPSAIGSICYLIIMLISINLKNKGLDLIVYNVVVDKMLFYVNVIPYTLLYLFIAIAGDFEAVIHHILLKRKYITKSFYFLNTTLQEVVLLAIGKDKFQLTPYQLHDNVNDTESGMLQEDRFTPEIKAYIVAILYRTSIFYIGILTLITIVNLVS